MIQVHVSTFIKDRFNHVQLCTDWLHNSQEILEHNFCFEAVDDCSVDARIGDLIANKYDICTQTTYTSEDPDQRIGMSRKQAVNRFIESADYSINDYLLLLDSDIIVTKQTIADAIADYEVLSKIYDVGGATLHPLGHIYNTEIINDKAFASVDLTGDAHMLFRKDHLIQVGNHFGDHYKGFADTQIQAIIKENRLYWSRTSPSYQVQHIGFGEGGTTIYKDKDRKPPWTMRPYWTHVCPRGVVKVQGFDVLQYADMVVKIGGDKAPLHYFNIKGVPHEG